VIRGPELARYVAGWGREWDCGFLASDAAGKSLDAVWLRLLRGENQGYGYVDDNTPELSIAVLPEHRGRGIGSPLLTHLFASACGNLTVSLSVAVGNPALSL
jgi:ribosomal protein S18 acetylase RimI-like enzyme